MRFPKLKFCDVVELEWMDIISDPKWGSLEDRKVVPAALCRYVGYYVNQDVDCVRFTNMVAMSDNEIDSVVFPKGVIKKITILKKANNGRNK